MAEQQRQNGKVQVAQLEPGKPNTIRDWYAEQLTKAGYLTASKPAVPDQLLDSPPIPATVENWIGQAMLLYGVPFQYLVPDEEMLPAKSIRFFYLNPEWINCLLQGACSVGRTSETDELADQLLRHAFSRSPRKWRKTSGRSAKRAADRAGTERAANPDATPPPRPDGQPVLNWPISGYLMRSPAVESWIGLEATATGVDSAGNALKPLQILRMDRLAPDILLCIYNGKVTNIEVKQPPEAIHFGAASTAGK